MTSDTLPVSRGGLSALFPIGNGFSQPGIKKKKGSYSLLFSLSRTGSATMLIVVEPLEFKNHAILGYFFVQLAQHTTATFIAVGFIKS